VAVAVTEADLFPTPQGHKSSPQNGHWQATETYLWSNSSKCLAATGRTWEIHTRSPLLDTREIHTRSNSLGFEEFHRRHTENQRVEIAAAEAARNELRKKQQEKERKEQERVLKERCSLVLPFLEHVTNNGSRPSPFTLKDLCPTSSPLLDYTQLLSLKDSSPKEIKSAFQNATSRAMAEFDAKEALSAEAARLFHKAASAPNPQNISRLKGNATRCRNAAEKPKIQLEKIQRVSNAFGVQSGVAPIGSVDKLERNVVEMAVTIGSYYSGSLSGIGLKTTALGARFPHQFHARSSYGRVMPSALAWLHLSNVKAQNPDLFRATCLLLVSNAAKKVELEERYLKAAEARLAATRQEGAHICTCVHAYVWIHAHVCIYIYMYIYICIYIYMYIYLHMCYARIMCSMRACLRVVCVTTPSTPPSTNQ
jgi:hypothetical protein